MRTLVLTTALATVAALPAAAATFDIPPAGQFGDFAPGAGGDVFALNAGAFGVTDPLSFQSGVFGNPGQADVGADDPDGVPSNRDASRNARTSLEAIAANTEGDRAGFFLYWTEGLGVNRLFATDTLDDPDGTLELLFTDTSENLSGIPGDVDLDLSHGAAQTRLFAEANANPAELKDYGRDNVVFADQVAPVPLPAGLPLLAAGLGALALHKRRAARRA